MQDISFTLDLILEIALRLVAFTKITFIENLNNIYRRKLIELINS